MVKKDKTTSNDLQNTTRKLKIEQHEQGVNPGAPGGLAVPAPQVTAVVLLLNDTKWRMTMFSLIVLFLIYKKM